MRKPRGKRHSLTSLLLAAAAAVLAGARSFTGVAEWVADAPPQVLAALGVRYDPLGGVFRPPGEATIRRVLETVDAAALDAAIGAWLAGRLREAGEGPGRRRALAVDGKAARGTRHASPDGQAAHLLAVAGQQASAVLAQGGVDGKTNEITVFQPLLEPLDLTGAVITADALHAQRGHAEFLVEKKPPAATTPATPPEPSSPSGSAHHDKPGHHATMTGPRPRGLANTPQAVILAIFV